MTTMRAGERQSLASGGAGELDLMGKLSTMVRRGSLFSGDDAPPSPRAARKSLGDGAPPFQFYVGGPQGNMAVVPPLAKEEAARRAELTQRAMTSFSDLHAMFAPVSLIETAVNNQLETLVEEEWRASSEEDGFSAPDEQTEAQQGEPKARRGTIEAPALLALDKQASESGDGGMMLTTNRRRTSVMTRPRPTGERSSDAGEELDFDGENLTVSVRKLMWRISKHDAEILGTLPRAVSNQDEEACDCRRAFAPEEASNNDGEDKDGAFDSAPPFVTPPRNHRHDPMPRFRRQSNLLCSSDEEEGEVQDRLTASVRRLVIGLKDDSDRHHGDNSRFRRCSSTSSSSSQQNRRRRGNSCPAPYSPTTRSVILDTPCPLLSASPRDFSPGCLSPAMDALPPPLTAMEQPLPPRKKSAFARIAPRLFESLHLRKPHARQKRKNTTAALLFTDQELESIEGARWKIVELAFRFGGKHRFYLVQAVNMFFPLVKYGRRGGPHATRIHCNHCGSLQWQHKRGGRLSEAVDLADVLQVTEGRRTAVFLKYETNSELNARSFSLIFSDRTLDLETHSKGHRDWLMSALRTLVSYAKRQRHAEQQAIAESAILSIDDFVDCGAPKTRATRSVTAGGALPSFPPANATIRAV